VGVTALVTSSWIGGLNMVQGKKVDMSNGTTKYQSNMSFPRKDVSDVRGTGVGKNERQNGS
jgi:hypothetical protein